MAASLSDDYVLCYTKVRMVIGSTGIQGVDNKIFREGRLC